MSSVNGDPDLDNKIPELAANDRPIPTKPTGKPEDQKTTALSLSVLKNFLSSLPIINRLFKVEKRKEDEVSPSKLFKERISKESPTALASELVQDASQDFKKFQHFRTLARDTLHELSHDGNFLFKTDEFLETLGRKVNEQPTELEKEMGSILRELKKEIGSSKKIDIGSLFSSLERVVRKMPVLSDAAKERALLGLLGSTSQVVPLLKVLSETEYGLREKVEKEILDLRQQVANLKSSHQLNGEGNDSLDRIKNLSKDQKNKIEGEIKIIKERSDSLKTHIQNWAEKAAPLLGESSAALTYARAHEAEAYLLHGIDREILPIQMALKSEESSEKLSDQLLDLDQIIRKKFDMAYHAARLAGREQSIGFVNIGRPQGADVFCSRLLRQTKNWQSDEFEEIYSRALGHVESALKIKDPFAHLEAGAVHMKAFEAFDFSIRNPEKSVSVSALGGIPEDKLFQKVDLHEGEVTNGDAKALASQGDEGKLARLERIEEEAIFHFKKAGEMALDSLFDLHGMGSIKAGDAILDILERKYESKKELINKVGFGAALGSLVLLTGGLAIVPLALFFRKAIVETFENIGVVSPSDLRMLAVIQMTQGGSRVESLLKSLNKRHPENEKIKDALRFIQDGNIKDTTLSEQKELESSKEGGIASINLAEFLSVSVERFLLFHQRVNFRSTLREGVTQLPYKQISENLISNLFKAIENLQPIVKNDQKMEKVRSTLVLQLGELLSNHNILGDVECSLEVLDSIIEEYNISIHKTEGKKKEDFNDVKRSLERLKETILDKIQTLKSEINEKISLTDQLSDDFLGEGEASQSNLKSHPSLISEFEKAYYEIFNRMVDENPYDSILFRKIKDLINVPVESIQNIMLLDEKDALSQAETKPLIQFFKDNTLLIPGFLESFRKEVKSKIASDSNIVDKLDLIDYFLSVETKLINFFDSFDQVGPIAKEIKKTESFLLDCVDLKSLNQMERLFFASSLKGFVDKFCFKNTKISEKLDSLKLFSSFKGLDIDLIRAEILSVLKTDTHDSYIKDTNRSVFIIDSDEGPQLFSHRPHEEVTEALKSLIGGGEESLKQAQNFMNQSCLAILRYIALKSCYDDSVLLDAEEKQAIHTLTNMEIAVEYSLFKSEDDKELKLVVYLPSLIYFPELDENNERIAPLIFAMSFDRQKISEGKNLLYSINQLEYLADLFVEPKEPIGAVFQEISTKKNEGEMKEDEYLSIKEDLGLRLKAGSEKAIEEAGSPFIKEIFGLRLKARRYLDKGKRFE